MNKTDIKTDVYTFEYCGESFRIDIVEDKSYHEAWIYAETYGVKSLMFGNAYMTAAEFLEIVEDNAEDYARDYIREYEMEA